MTDLPLCDFKNCKYQFNGNCQYKAEYERCEFARMKNRLQIVSSGSDKKDELREAVCDELERFYRLTNELESMVKKGG